MWQKKIDFAGLSMSQKAVTECILGYNFFDYIELIMISRLYQNQDAEILNSDEDTKEIWF